MIKSKYQIVEDITSCNQRLKKNILTEGLLFPISVYFSLGHVDKVSAGLFPTMTLNF